MHCTRAIVRAQCQHTVSRPPQLAQLNNVRIKRRVCKTGEMRSTNSRIIKLAPYANSARSHGECTKVCSTLMHTHAHTHTPVDIDILRQDVSGKLCVTVLSSYYTTHICQAIRGAKHMFTDEYRSPKTTRTTNTSNNVNCFYIDRVLGFRQSLSTRLDFN